MNDEFNIEDYLNSLPDHVNVINIPHKNLNYLPDLSRFKKLERLYCNNNNLTSLPVSPKHLKYFSCSYNNLTSLPILPEKLQLLCCSYNNLTSLPVLPENLKRLYCFNNKLTSLPVLPKDLIWLYNHGNPIYDIINNNNLNIIKKNIIILNNFRHLYYCLKYRKRFLRMMEPVIKKRYHPSYLDDLKEDDDLDEKLNGW